MTGILVDTVTAQPLQTVTVERAGTEELHRRYLRADGTRCGAGDQPLGVCRVSSTAAGDHVPVDTDGIVVVEAGAAITLTEGAATVMPDAQGRAIPHTGTVPAGGWALTAASAAGDLIAVLLNRA